jgi:membrane associated rhomboid family serine protease
MTSEPNLPVRVARERRRADEWSLVLTAADIEHDVAPAGRDWVVLVGDDDLAAALEALDAYDQEQRAAQREPPAPIEYGPTLAGPAYFIALLMFHFWVEYIGDTFAWEDAGRAYAARIVNGEWWRAATALTLHAGLGHVLANTVAGSVFAGVLCRITGPGTALWIMLLAGGAGNLVNAYLRAGPHAAIGASTAVFGALGALAGIEAMRRYRPAAPGPPVVEHPLMRRRKVWIPIGAAVAILAMLGAGAQTDVWAHLFGLVAGFVAGGAAAHLHQRPPSAMIEWPLAAAGVLVVAGCWRLAM